MIDTTYSQLPHMPLLMHQDKFVAASQRFGYRVIHVPYEPCPNGSSGCVLCKGDRIGFHRREPRTGPVQDTLMDGRADGIPARLSHRFRTGPVIIRARVGRAETTLTEGVDFTTEGREIRFGAARPDRQVPFTAEYTATLESWVNMQHAYGDFAGLKRQSERNKLEKVGLVEQGGIMMSIHHDAPGFGMMIGDVFIPVDGQDRFGRHIVAGRVNNRPMHRYLHGVERAYGVDEEARAEYPVAVRYDAARHNFEIEDDLEDDVKVAVIYRAAPQYFVSFDIGEFRHPMAQDHQRLVLLSKLESVV